MRDGKTIIGVLASHDSVEKNQAVANIFASCMRSSRTRKTFSHFRFLFTGGTYDRLFSPAPPEKSQLKPRASALTPDVQRFLHEDCGVIVLPHATDGGVIVLAALLTQRRLNLLWPFFTPRTTHLLAPENLALLRLADQWRVKKLMNTGSVMEWLHYEGDRDALLNPQTVPLSLELPGSGISITTCENAIGTHVLPVPEARTEVALRLDSERSCAAIDPASSIIALISHDEMKSRMVDFVIDNERELSRFKRILTTGTTGKLVQDHAPALTEKIHRYHSGPKGGDIELAAEVLFGGCQVVIFFVDPLRPHPHTDDIRVIFGACMIHDGVRMISNEIQARDWMNRVMRGGR